MSEELLQQFSFEYLLKKNQEYLEKCKNNPLIKLISDTEILSQKMIEEKILDGVQVLSNYFQKVVLLRNVFSEIPKFCEVTQEHLDEEFGHHLDLMKERNNRPCVWDPILDAASAWFAWKMFMLDNEEKTVLVHLVLETSAALFFQQARKVMKHYGGSEYFKVHSEADEKHEKMGMLLLENLSSEKYKRLLEVQKQGWDVLNVACQRIAELCFNLPCPAFES